MNSKKWENQDHSREEWLAKLGEEFGEVAREIAKLSSPSVGPRSARQAESNLVMELDHVEFIARCWRGQIERDNGVRPPLLRYEPVK